MDNSQFYHICGEVIIIAGISLYFAKQLKIHKNEIITIKEDFKNYQEQTDKNLNTIYKILENAFNINTSSIRQNQTKSNPPLQNRDSGSPRIKDSDTGNSQERFISNNEENQPQLPPQQSQLYQQSQSQNIMNHMSMQHIMNSNPLAMLAMTSPIGVIDIIQEPTIRQRSQSRATNIQIVDDKEESSDHYNQQVEIEDDDDTEDIQEELNELETNTQDVENNSSSDNSKDDKFEENIVSRQEQDLPFYPEPSKNKKKSKK